MASHQISGLSMEKNLLSALTSTATTSGNGLLRGDAKTPSGTSAFNGLIQDHWHRAQKNAATEESTEMTATAAGEPSPLAAWLQELLGVDPEQLAQGSGDLQRLMRRFHGGTADGAEDDSPVLPGLLSHIQELLTQATQEGATAQGAPEPAAMIRQLRQNIADMLEDDQLSPEMMDWLRSLDQRLLGAEQQPPNLAGLADLLRQWNKDALAEQEGAEPAEPAEDDALSLAGQFSGNDAAALLTDDTEAAASHSAAQSEGPQQALALLLRKLLAAQDRTSAEETAGAAEPGEGQQAAAVMLAALLMHGDAQATSNSAEPLSAQSPAALAEWLKGLPLGQSSEVTEGSVHEAKIHGFRLKDWVMEQPELALLNDDGLLKKKLTRLRALSDGEALEGVGQNAPVSSTATLLSSASPSTSEWTAPGTRPATAVNLPPIQTPVRSESWSEALQHRVRLMATADLQRAEIRLRPEHLGPVEIRMTIQNDQVSMQFSAPHAMTRDAIEAALPKLREMLNEQNLNLVNVDIGQRESFDREGLAGQSGSGQSSSGHHGFGGDGVDLDEPLPTIKTLDGLVDAYA